MNDWSVRVEWTGTGPLSDDQAEALDEQLAAHAGRVGDEPNGNTSAQLHVKAGTIRQAFDAAVRATEAACKALGLPCTVVATDVATWAEFERRLAEPPVPPLVGPTEVATRLGVTRQRASDIIKANAEVFRAVAHTSRGPLYLEAALDRFEASWERRSGRPPKKAAAAKESR